MLSPFDISKNILKKESKLSNEVIDSDVNSFMLNRIFSNDINMCLIANELNKNGYSKKMIYDCYYYGIPKTSKFIPYNSKKEKREEELQYMMEYFQCSQTTAKQYLALISEDEKKTIVEYFKNRGIQK